MLSPINKKSEIRQILAADQRFGEITPDNDHIWELSTLRGEPPAIAIQTTYGLRAYGMRIFPRFIQNKIPLSNPLTFYSFPSVEFSAPNFVSINYQPISTIDVNQKIWVPNSHTVVGEIALVNKVDQPVSLGMEWVVQLNPLHAGSQMTPSQISINTVLQGQTQNIYPVFFLTGGPQSNPSAYPNLGINIVFTPGSTRKFSWALASLDSVENSFYGARKFTSYSLENEQFKIQMIQKNQFVNFEFEDKSWNDLFIQSQIKTFQFLLPPHHQFDSTSYVTNRLPDHGFSQSGKNWGIQNVLELWEISQLLLPVRPDLIKAMVENFIDQQAENGLIDTQITWNENLTGIPAAPILASIAAELHPYLNDEEWLSSVYPALMDSLKVWFKPEYDSDEDGFPEWQHLVQTGISELVKVNPEIRNKLEILINSAEWLSLACLLWNECKSLTAIARWIKKDLDLDWLTTQADRLQSLINTCLENNKKICCFRDKTTHLSSKGKILHTFHQNGSKTLDKSLKEPERIFVQVASKDGFVRPVACQISSQDGKKEIQTSLTGKDFHWHEEQGITVTNTLFSSVKEITISGLKKGDTAVVGTPDFTIHDPSFMIPMWAGLLSAEQAQQNMQQGCAYLDSSTEELPAFLKIMWIKGLMKYNYRDQAAHFYQKWYLDESDPAKTETNDGLSSHIRNLTTASLHEIPPLLPFLQLLGIQRITDTEAIVNGFNEFFPKVNVQYKQIIIALESSQTKFSKLNGEFITVEERGSHRILLS